jgi:hypothetical protein
LRKRGSFVEMAHQSRTGFKYEHVPEEAYDAINILSLSKIGTIQMLVLAMQIMSLKYGWQLMSETENIRTTPVNLQEANFFFYMYYRHHMANDTHKQNTVCYTGNFLTS